MIEPGATARHRRAIWPIPMAACAFAVALSVPGMAQPQSFGAYVESLWPRARAGGISRTTFDSATSGLSPDAEVLSLTRRQPEYIRPLGAYIGTTVSASRISRGAQLARTWSDTLGQVEKTFGVDRFVVLGIWAIETEFGKVPSRKDVFRSTATLAYARYRDTFFRDEFLAALHVMQEGHIPREKMRGSWAGAMGQAQFIPSSFLKYAVDFSGDGQRDIWTTVPDVLGSIANYLAKSGWERGMPWGFEVMVPNGFDYRRSRASLAEWKRLGVKRADGQPLPERHDAVMLFPSGADGPAFLVTGNYLAIKAYNNSDAYALAVAHLADRMRGGKAIVTPWPANDHPLSRDNRIVLQRRLSELGYTVNNFQGQIDFDLRDSIRDVQAKAGWRADGNPTEQILKHVLSLPAVRR